MIGFSFLGLGAHGLSGIGRYSVSLFEAVVASYGSAAEGSVAAFVPRGSRHHFSEAARRCIREVRLPANPIARIIYEQTIFPIVLRRAGVRVLLNAAFTGPLWGVGNMVTVVHDLFFRVVPELVRRDRRIFLNLLTPPTMRRSQAVIAVSENTARDIAACYPDVSGRVAVVPLACGLPGASQIDASDSVQPHVIMVSTITANKNPDAFVAAVSAMNAKDKCWCGIIVGNDPEKLAAAAVQKYGSSDCVELRSHLPDSELVSLLRTSMALVVPSYYEGFGLPVLEAQSMGVPVLCSTGGALPEVAGDGALFFRPDRPSELLSALIELRDTPGKREELIAAGYRNVAKYSWERTAEETLRILGGLKLV